MESSASGSLPGVSPAVSRAPARGRARRLAAWLLKEFLHVLPAFVFFFAAFVFINETQWLMVQRSDTHFSLALLAVSAGIVAKVLLVADKLPFISPFPARPLIYNTLWKVFVYSVGAFLARFLEHLVEFVIHHRSFTDGLRHYLSEWPWNIFWAAQLWYGALFIVFVTFRDLAEAVGVARVRRLFIGR
jgi:hypothetical protein